MSLKTERDERGKNRRPTDGSSSLVRVADLVEIDGTGVGEGMEGVEMLLVPLKVAKDEVDPGGEVGRNVVGFEGLTDEDGISTRADDDWAPEWSLTARCLVTKSSGSSFAHFGSSTSSTCPPPCLKPKS